MPIEKRPCPKCSSPMYPGCPVDISDASVNVAYWSNELPLLRNWLIAEVISPRGLPKHRLMGFSCSRCGFVEMYAVAEAELKAFLKAEQASGEAPPSG